jgi:YHS domain-containing protein
MGATDRGDTSNLFRDPVCGHDVDPATAFASEEHDGRTYYFDSRECHYEFRADPHRYGHVHAPDDPRPEQDEVTGP